MSCSPSASALRKEYACMSATIEPSWHWSAKDAAVVACCITSSTCFKHPYSNHWNPARQSPLTRFRFQSQMYIVCWLSVQMQTSLVPSGEKQQAVMPRLPGLQGTSISKSNTGE